VDLSFRPSVPVPFCGPWPLPASNHYIARAPNDRNGMAGRSMRTPILEHNKSDQATGDLEAERFCSLLPPLMLEGAARSSSDGVVLVHGAAKNK
jgi:hypothetical protein